MKRYNGKSIFKGIAIGTIKVLSKTSKDIIDTSKKQITDTEAEVARYVAARDKAIEQLQAIFKRAVNEVGQESANIFDVQSMLLSDEDYTDAVYSYICNDKCNAEYAVYQSGEDIAEAFSSMEDEYMRARSADIKDVSHRVICILCGVDEENDETSSDADIILCADELTPAETVALDKSKVKAFVTKYGSSQSHTAILARTMNIPALIGVIVDSEWNGKTAIVDSFAGDFIIDPDDDTLAQAKKLQAEEAEKAKRLLALKDKPTVTKDGRKVRLYANIGSVDDASIALENGAEGIGLFRSEFLYIGRNTFPTEEEQFVAYKNVVRKMAGKLVVIRTLDIGADKKADYFNLGKEDNPALGFRAIRICLERPEIFKTQLRAIYRASAFGNIAVMFPMIISVDEVQRAKAIAAEVRASLNKKGIPYGNVEQGIMIETPAAVLMSDELAKEVDFFSIGTNDLTQYTLAIDRQNSHLEAFYDPHHPAVLRAIKMTVDNGHKHNCWVGICGELGADVSLTKEFLDMGIDELSVSSSRILSVRETVRSL